MTEDVALSKLRLAIGDPPTQGRGCVYDYTLGLALDDALTRLFQDLECRMVSQPTMISLVAGEPQYSLPSDVMRVLTVRLGDNLFLLPDSIYRWSRDSINWQASEPSTPGRFTQAGRNLVLYPAPDASAVASYPHAALFYIGNSPGMQPLGVPGITDNDMLAAIHDAALVLDGLVSPGDDQVLAAAIQKRMAVNKGLYDRYLHNSKRDWQSPVVLHKPRMSMGGRYARWTR